MEPKQKLGRYEIVRRLARGGMAEVWLAVSRGTGGFTKRCVLKTILPVLAENPAAFGKGFGHRFFEPGAILGAAIVLLGLVLDCLPFLRR